RDWGHAKNYVEAMWLMLQQKKAEDYIIATGVTTSVRDFVRMAFAEAGIILCFEGSGEHEVGIVEHIDEEKYRHPVPRNLHLVNLLGKTIVQIDQAYYRPTEVDVLIGDPTKAKTQLGWKLRCNLKGLVK